MSQFISFLGTLTKGDTAPKAVAPVVHQASVVIAINAGLTYSDVLPAIPSGSCAADAGQIVNTGCFDLGVKATYLTGAGCDPCTVDTLTTVDVDLIIPANSAFPMPPGYVAQLQIQTVDSDGNPVANSTEVKVRYYGAYSPGCNGCPLVP